MRFASAALILLLAVGCSAIRFGDGEAAPDLEGSWAGSLELQGEALDGQLVLEQDGTSLDAFLTAPGIDLVAEGRGEVIPEGELWLDLGYDLECPGTARLVGRLDEEGILTGRVEAQDCTGTASGTFTFRRGVDR